MEKEKYPEWYVDVKNICPNRITQNFLDFMDLKLEDCKGKNIASIGWWFGIFEMDAAKAWAKVIIVDPMFLDQDEIVPKLQENIGWLKSKTKWKMENKCWEMRNDLIKILSDTSDEREKKDIKEKLHWCDEWQTNAEGYIRRRKILLNHLNNWQENQVKYELTLNPSSWDNIQWIDANSQDMVVIAHTLWHIQNKSSWDIKDFLNQWYEILKSGWKLWIIDYVWDIGNLEKILEKTELKKYYKANKWSFVCCFDKKWLNKFLQEDIR